jgi:hypothetical protein
MNMAKKRAPAEPPPLAPDEREAAKAAVCFYGVDILPKLRAMDRRARRKLLKRAGRLCLRTPLQYSRGPHTFPEWPWGGLSGLQVVAVMVFGLWVEQFERPALCAPLMEAWPIAEVLFLVDGPGERE